MTTDHTLIPVRETTAGGCCGGAAADTAQDASCCSTATAQASATPVDAHDDHHAAHDHGEHGHAGHDHGHTHGHGGHTAAAPVSAEDLAECPVMPGSPVVKSVAEAQGLFRDHNGQRYWFCCASCGPLFDADPDKYAHAA